LTCTYRYKRTVGYGRGVSLAQAGGIEALHVMSQRTPKELLEGDVELTGSIDRCFIDRDMVGKVLSPNADDELAELPEFTIYLYPLGEEAGKPVFTLTGCKFSDWSLDVSQDAVVAESVTFLFTGISAGVV